MALFLPYKKYKDVAFARLKPQYVADMETIQNQDPELNPDRFQQYHAAPPYVVVGQPIEEIPPTNGTKFKQAMGYLLSYFGYTIVGALLMLGPAAILYGITSSGATAETLVLVGSQFAPLYVFWKRKTCDFSWINTPNIVKLLLWVVAAWLGRLCFTLFFGEVYTIAGIDIDSQAGMLERGFIPLSMLAVCVLAPLSEECLFRGMIERKLLETNWNPWYAIVISSLLFALLHMDPFVSLITFISGLLMGWIYYRTRNIWLTIFMHAFNNTFASVMDLLGDNFDDMPAPDEPFYFYVLLLVAGLVFVYVSCREIGKIAARDEQLAALNERTNHDDASFNRPFGLSN